MTFRVLLVCMGNICRSPTAEGVLRHFIKNNRWGDKVEVDSAGTHGYHVSEAPDSRTQRAASVRGYNLSQLRARKVARQDLDYFDLILAMDKSNLDNLRRMATPEQQERLKRLLEFAPQLGRDEVPDPYYGGPAGFDAVLDLVEVACDALVRRVQAELS